MTRFHGVLLACALLAGCASPQSAQLRPAVPPTAQDAAPDPDQTAAAVAPIESTTGTYDPWERFNRGVYRFNARFDEAIFLPVANSYQRVVPAPLRTGVGNFFANLGEVSNTANHLLQARPRYGARSAARFLINSTIGLAGFIDVAEMMGLSRVPTHFGNTLGRWGVGAGPYLVVPFLGPSNLRDGVGQLTDLGVRRAVDAGGLYSSDNAWALFGLNAVDTRARIGFRYYQSASPFEYDMIRFLHTRMRAIEIEGAQVLPDVPSVIEPATGPERDTPAADTPLPASPLE